ncbi:hypothetical protein Srut_28980 [Streptomyces rutgersensis]|nr:hypothetical protein Srut_28980 [Streptomyces rutgersensis]
MLAPAPGARSVSGGRPDAAASATRLTERVRPRPGGAQAGAARQARSGGARQAGAEGAGTAAANGRISTFRHR